jgi:hypothetical protein
MMEIDGADSSDLSRKEESELIVWKITGFIFKPERE